MRKALPLIGGILLSLLLLAACTSGGTTGATNVTATTATLSGSGSCDAPTGKTCGWFFEVAANQSSLLQGIHPSPTATDTPTQQAASGSHTGSANVTGLTAGTQYFFKLCGPATYSQPTKIVCVGPDAQFGTTGSFTTTGAPAPPPPTKITHVVVLLMENHGFSQIIGSSQAPYINSLANTYGLATNYFATDHPSLPNYIELTSGGSQGVSDDADPGSHRLTANSIFQQLGTNSRGLVESMPGNCGQTSGGEYAAKHNPFAYYVNARTACNTNDVPFGSAPDLSAAYTFITPNLIDDMHDGTIGQGDNFLKGYVPKLLATPQYQAGSTAIFIVWDEDNGGSNQVPAIVVSPYTHGVKDGTHYTHYSLLRTAEQLLGLSPLGNAATATSMLEKFGF